jgi:hypothetical protein
LVQDENNATAKGSQVILKHSTGVVSGRLKRAKHTVKEENAEEKLNTLIVIPQ